MKLVAGSGGKGASSFHSEPRKEWGGPDGGNGGDGGSIIIKGRPPDTRRELCLFGMVYKVSLRRHRLCFFCPLTADRLVKSLAQVFPVYKGEDGQSGGSKNCYGRNGNTTYVHVSPCVDRTCFMSRFSFDILYFAPSKVPLGTLVKEEGRNVTDLSHHGQEFMAASGGAGGKGNRFFLTNENRAPMTSTQGVQGRERLLHLELRTMAHAGLVRRCCS